MQEIGNDPSRRCIYCNGRQVFYEQEGRFYAGLKLTERGYVCNNAKECRKNQIAERLDLKVTDMGTESGNIYRTVKFRYGGEPLMEISKEVKL